MRCAAITRAGARCKGEATHGSYCWSHAPETAEARKRRASRGGRSGGNGRGKAPNAELGRVKELLEELTARVLGEEDSNPIDTGSAAVANQILNTRLRAIELERRVRTTDELAEEIRQLKERLDRGQRQAR